MKKTRIIIALLAILVIIMPFSLMACKKDNSDTGATTWATIFNTNYDAMVREIEFSQINEITLPLIDPIKDYEVITDQLYDLDIAVFYENTATIQSVIVYNYKDNTAAAYNFAAAFDPNDMDIELTKDGLVVINNDVTDVNVILNSTATQLIKTNSPIDYAEALNLFTIDGDYFVYKDGAIKRLGIDLDNADITRKAYNNGYIQTSGADFATIYANTGELILSYSKPTYITRSNFNLLDNGDILIINTTNVEQPTYRDLNESEYDYKIVDDAGDATYAKVEYKYMSAANKTISAVSYDFIPMYYASAEMAKAIANTPLKDEYIGLIVGLKPNGKIVSEGVDSAAYYALKADGTMVEIQELANAHFEGVRLIGTDTFACSNDNYTAIYNAKGEFINSFHTPDNAIIGSCYLYIPNKVIYSFDGTPKYELEETDVVLDWGNNHVTVLSGNTLKIIYKSNNIATLDITDYNAFTAGIILLEKDGTTTVYKVDGTQITSVNATFDMNKMYKFASGVLCLGSNDKYYTVK